MLSTLATVLPIFALILAGWLMRRMRVLGPHATGELNRFVIYLGLPALLFEIVANAKPAEIWQPAFIGAFGLGCVAVFALTVLARVWSGRSLADAAIDGLNAGYANVGFIGFPLGLAAFGRAALPPALIATLVTVCAVFAGAIVLIEIGLQGEGDAGGKGMGGAVLKVAASLARNPLLIAPAAGALFPLTGAAVPAPVETFLKLLGGAASPCALVALGLFLAQKPRDGEVRDGGARGGGAGRAEVAVLAGLKLLGQPALTWILALFVFRLPTILVHAAVLLAALPTGTGPFMLAEFYRREADVTSRVILASTVLSIGTLSAYLYLAR
jgi:malonate transporter